MVHAHTHIHRPTLPSPSLCTPPQAVDVGVGWWGHGGWSLGEGGQSGGQPQFAGTDAAYGSLTYYSLTHSLTYPPRFSPFCFSYCRPNKSILIPHSPFPVGSTLPCPACQGSASSRAPLEQEQSREVNWEASSETLSVTGSAARYSTAASAPTPSVQ